MRNTFSLIVALLVAFLVHVGAAKSEDTSALKKSVSVGTTGVHIVHKKGVKPKFSVRTGSFICEVACHNGGKATTTCSGGQNCCGNAITCQAWCTNEDASACGSAPGAH